MHRRGFCGSRVILLMILVSAVAHAQSASAARLLDVYYEVDGAIVAHTYYDDNGRADAATVWRYLAEPPIMVDDESTRVDVDAYNPLDARLNGDVRVRILHGSRVIAEARVSDLTLHRADPATQMWHLTESETERTADIAGLGPPSQPAVVGLSPVGLLAAAGSVVLFLAGIVVLVILLVGSRRAGKE